MEKDYEERAIRICNEVLSERKTIPDTSFDIKKLTQEDLANVLKIKRTRLTNFLSEKYPFTKNDVLERLFANKNNDDDDIIKFLIMKYELEQIYNNIVDNNNPNYRRAAYTGIATIYDWILNGEHPINQKINFFHYLDNFFVYRNPVNYFFYNLSKRSKGILLSFMLDRDKELIIDFSFSYLNDEVKTNNLTEYINEEIEGYTLRGINNPISIEKFAELLIKIHKHEQQSFLYYSEYYDELDLVQEYIKKNNKKTYDELKNVSFYDLMALFKRDMNEKIILKDLLDYYSISSNNIYNSSYINLESLMALINKVTLNDFEDSDESKDYKRNQPHNDKFRNSKYTNFNYISQNKKKNMKLVNMNINHKSLEKIEDIKSLLTRVKNSNIDLFSITSSNVVKHQEYIRKLAEENEMQYIAGTEIECNINSLMGDNILLSGKMLVGILCYGFNPKEMKAALIKFDDAKRRCYLDFLSKLSRRIDRNLEDAIKVGCMDRKSIVNYLISYGDIENEAQGYELIEDVGYDEVIMSPDVLSKIATKCRGTLVLAHPYDANYGSQEIKLNQIDLRKLIVKLKKYNLSGIEIDKDRYDSKDISYLRSLAKEYDLFITYGNGYTGTDVKEPLGMYLDDNETNKMLECLENGKNI